ncbi:transposase [Chloroflexota bacterium]
MRSERALLLALVEMYEQGVSTRKVAAIAERLCGSEVSSMQVSRTAALLDDACKPPVLSHRPYISSIRDFLTCLKKKVSPLKTFRTSGGIFSSTFRKQAEINNFHAHLISSSPVKYLFTALGSLDLSIMAPSSSTMMANYMLRVTLPIVTEDGACAIS